VLQLKIWSLLRAIWSFYRWGDVPIVKYDQRQLVCLRCEYVQVVKHGIFCRACGCPPSALSDMRTKWRMRDLKCPLGKW
jgi:hypothetical protein